MRGNVGKLLLTAAVVLVAFTGKGATAKAYDVVGGTAYISWDEYIDLGDAKIAQLENGTVASKYRIIDLETDKNGMPVITGELLNLMDKYVPASIFDYDWYLRKHPELVEACGTDKNAVYTFYATTGQAVGWQGRIAPDKLICPQNFDDARYAAENPDVAAAVGSDKMALYMHYAGSGIAEGRKGYATFETVNTYLKMYEISSQIIDDGMSDREVVKAVHDWMVLNIAYDYDNYLKRTIPRESYEIEGAINKGKAVCDGYAKTFRAFMDIQGIECVKISGTANGGGHAWNKVKLNGEYYYIDVTWDDPVPDKPGQIYWYNYYLTKDPTFGGDHAPENDGEEWY
ncbi:MAG: hypothetical protein K2P64_08965 [Lachnospiraceae bacterium]|nr:hypothetical protein [Lachnospiraceae bacterium]